VTRALERARLAREVATLRVQAGAEQDMGLVGTSPAVPPTSPA
jgi:two-component system NtrC family response regulator